MLDQIRSLMGQKMKRRRVPNKKFTGYVSTYTALTALLMSAFMAQPTLASLGVHALLALVLLINNFLCHWEGRGEGYHQGYDDAAEEYQSQKSQ